MKLSTSKNEICIGMYWANLSGLKPKAELVLLSSEANKKFGFSKSTQGSSKSIQAALSSEPNQRGLISGAAVLSDLFSDLILITEIDDESVWVCAVSNNEVIVGGDVIVAYENALSVIEDLSSSISTEAISIVADQAVVDRLEIEVDEISGFDDLVELCGITKISSEYSKYKIQKISSGVSRPLVLLGALSVILIIYQLVGPGIGPKKPALVQLPEIDMAVVADMEKRKQDQIQTDALRKAYAEEVEWLKKDLINVKSSEIIGSVHKRMMETPKFAGGWYVEKIIFSSSNSDSVQFLWKNTGSGTPSSLRAILGSESLLKFDINGESALNFVKLDAILNNDSNEDVLSLINNNRYDYELLMGDLLVGGIEWAFSEIKITPRPQAIQNVVDPKLASERQLSLTGRKISFTGNSEISFLLLMKIFDTARVFKLSGMVFNFGDNQSWTINGEFYESVK